jgi:hypothetical protein
MPWENKAEYEALLQEYTSLYSPWGEIECGLLQRVVDCFWRLRRAERVQAAFLREREKSIRESSNGELCGDDALASMLTDPAQMRKLSLSMRYVSAAERAFGKAMKDFDKAQHDRLSAELQAVAESESGIEADIEASVQEALAQIGFVSQPELSRLTQPLPISPVVAPPRPPQAA